MDTESELDSGLPPEVLELKHSAPRDAERATRARQAYVAAAGALATIVSNLPPSRLNGWQERWRSIWIARRREKIKMLQLAMTVVLALALVLGGGATTAALAQAAAPDDALYGVKLWTEDVRLGLESNPGEKLALALQFTDRRAAEVHEALQAEESVPESLRARFENQLQEMLRLATGMSDGEIVGALERVRNQAREQERIMSQLQVATEPALQSRARVMSMLQAQAQIAQGGIEDPNWLRAQFRAGMQNQNQPAVPAGGADAGGALGPDSGNPWAAGTPTPGSSYGPGASQNPWSEGTPTPGSGYGPGPGTGECIGCTASPNPGTGYGPGPGTGECSSCTAMPGGASGPGPGN